MTGLHWATFINDRQLVKFLLEKGATITRSSQDATPVDIAGLSGFPKIVRTFSEFCKKKVAEAGQIRVSKTLSETKRKVATAKVAPAENHEEDTFQNQNNTDLVNDDDVLKTMTDHQHTVERMVPNSTLEMSGHSETATNAISKNTTLERPRVLKVFRYEELGDLWEKPLYNCFYWSAFFGDRNMIRHCIDDFSWSPFMPSYKGRNCLTAAITGKKKKIVEQLLSMDYEGN